MLDLKRKRDEDKYDDDRLLKKKEIYVIINCI